MESVPDREGKDTRFRRVSKQESACRERCEEQIQKQLKGSDCLEGPAMNAGGDDDQQEQQHERCRVEPFHSGFTDARLVELPREVNCRSYWVGAEAPGLT